METLHSSRIDDVHCNFKQSFPGDHSRDRCFEFSRPSLSHTDNSNLASKFLVEEHPNRESEIRTANPGDCVLVRWDEKWAPETGGWSAGVVKEISRGRTKNPNGPGVVTRGWSVVEYPGQELHVHLLDEQHHVNCLGDVEMAWKHNSHRSDSESAEQEQPATKRAQKRSRLAYEHKRRHKHKKTTSGSRGGCRSSVTSSFCLASQQNDAIADDSASDAEDSSLRRLGQPSGGACDLACEPAFQPSGPHLMDGTASGSPSPTENAGSESFSLSAMKADSDRSTAATAVLFSVPAPPSGVSCAGACSFYADELGGGEDAAAVTVTPAAPQADGGLGVAVQDQVEEEDSNGVDSEGPFSKTSSSRRPQADNYPFHALTSTLWGPLGEQPPESERTVEYVASQGETTAEIADRLAAEGCTALHCTEEDWEVQLLQGTVIEMLQTPHGWGQEGEFDDGEKVASAFP